MLTFPKRFRFSHGGMIDGHCCRTGRFEISAVQAGNTEALLLQELKPEICAKCWAASDTFYPPEKMYDAFCIPARLVTGFLNFSMPVV